MRGHRCAAGSARWALDAYVDAMVISGEEGITKPDRRVFDKARALLDADDVVFVDDAADNVRGAMAVGMRGLRLRHPTEEPEPVLTEISDLIELLTYL